MARRGLRSLLLLTALVASTGLAATRAPALGRRAMVATAHPGATHAALAMLRQGGSVVDAAVAAAFVIGVAEPFSAGIGGGGFALWHDAASGTTRALDFRERAPLAAHRDIYLDVEGKVIPGASTTGHRAVAVPGTVAGLIELWRRGGRLSLDTILAPAVDLAQAGLKVSPRLHDAIEARREDLLRDQGARQIFVLDGQAPPIGHLLMQRDLAETLRQIAASEGRAFYRGDIAGALVGDMAENGGLISAQDLGQYRPIWRQPRRFVYRGHEIVTMPLPSSGGLVMQEIFDLLQRGGFARLPYHDPRRLHLYVEACRRAYADRAQALGDPAFLRQSVEPLVAAPRLARRFASIDPLRRTPSRELDKESPAPELEGEHTSHLLVVDAGGDAVSLTFTINTLFGAAVVVPGTGIVLNNEMDDFSAKPGVPNSYGLVGNAANAIAPAKIPLSSMSPTLVFADGELRLATGSPGGSTIITTVVQIIVHLIDDDMDVAQAVAAPRVHHQWLPDQIFIEPLGLDPATRAGLFGRGHTLMPRAPWGNAMAISRDADGWLRGAADPRGEGLAQGR